MNMAPIDFSIENNQSSTMVNIDTNVNTKKINQKRKMLEQKLEENTLAMKKYIIKYVIYSITLRLC